MDWEAEREVGEDCLDLFKKKKMAEATSLLKSLSVPEPLRSQLVQKSRLGFMLILDADGVMELIRYHSYIT